MLWSPWNCKQTWATGLIISPGFSSVSGLTAHHESTHVHLWKEIFPGPHGSAGRVRRLCSSSQPLLSSSICLGFKVWKKKNLSVPFTPKLGIKPKSVVASRVVSIDLITLLNKLLLSVEAGLIRWWGTPASIHSDQSSWSCDSRTRQSLKNYTGSRIKRWVSTYPFLSLFRKLLASVGKYIGRKCRCYCSRPLCWSQRWNIKHEITNDCCPSCHKTPTLFFFF